MKPEKHGTNGSLNCPVCIARRKRQEKIRKLVYKIIEKAETKDDLQTAISILSGAKKESE